MSRLGWEMSTAGPGPDNGAEGREDVGSLGHESGPDATGMKSKLKRKKVQNGGQKSCICEIQSRQHMNVSSTKLQKVELKIKSQRVRLDLSWTGGMAGDGLVMALGRTVRSGHVASEALPTPYMPVRGGRGIKKIDGWMGMGLKLGGILG